MTTSTNNNERSEDVNCRFFSTGKKELLLNHLDFDIEEMASEGVDSLAGQKRDDPYTVTNYFSVTFNGTQTDQSLLDEFLANIASKDANTGENPAVVTVEMETKQAVTNTYVFTAVTRKPFKLGASGRSDPFKFSSGFKCKKFVKS
jgi:hypothetical protein